MTEIEVKDHLHEIAHNEFCSKQRQNNCIVSQLVEQIRGCQEALKTKDNNMQAELKAKDDEIQSLEDELRTQEFEHDEELNKIEQEYADKRKHVYSYQNLSMLERNQMLEIQK